MEIDLEKPIPGCTNFLWKEFLWLPKWGIYVYPDVMHLDNIRRTAAIMERVRSIFYKPIRITSGFRPQQYNRLIKGAKSSAHTLGLACDFIVDDCEGVVGCEYARQQILPFLDAWGIRLEDKAGSDWIHIDLFPPGKTGRFFKVEE